MESTFQTSLVDSERYRIDDASAIYSPSPVVFKELLQANLAEMLRIAGSPDRLRPHCKTHKMTAIIDMKRALGIKKFKCATIAEAEMLGEAGCESVLIAYQLVGPNVGRLAQLIDKFPGTRFATLVDDFTALDAILHMMSEHRPGTLELFIDIDPGMRRSGIEPNEIAIELYEAVATSEVVNPGGIHWYDGHINQSDIAERRIAVEHEYQMLSKFRNQLMMSGFEVAEIVVSGTGAFPVWAELEEPNLTLSPGTTVLYDVGYLQRFPDMNFVPAMGVLTRVVSKTRAGQLTLDLGHKAIAADQPAGHRAYFPDIPDAKELLHSEEHLVIESRRASEFAVGDTLLALPYHVCPTSALHQSVAVIENGQVIDQWTVDSRNRCLTI